MTIDGRAVVPARGPAIREKAKLGMNGVQNHTELFSACCSFELSAAIIVDFVEVADIQL